VRLLFDCDLVKDPPVVTMLWESVDPAKNLTKRFGFRSGPAAAEWVADVLESNWGLPLTSVTVS
jgi:hypothetical protein